MDDATINPGTRVRTADGIDGIVDSIVTDESGIELEAIIARIGDTGGRYRVPADTVSVSHDESGQDVVILSAPLTALEHYHSESVRRLDTADDVTHSMAVHSHAEGIMERLQTGVDALTHGGRDSHAAVGTARHDEETEVLRVPVVEEELIPGTTQVHIGTLHVHKSVESMPETVHVSVSHEEPEVTYIDVDEYDHKAPYHPGETYIPIMGEKVVVEKRTVVIGYLRVRKNSVSEEQVITETVRRERVTVDQDANMPTS